MIFQRIKNLWFWSGISKEHTIKNPHSFVKQHIAEQEIKDGGYIIGLSEEEQSFKDTLNSDNRDTKLS